MTLQNHVPHLPALLLSAAIHSGFWIAAGPSGSIGTDAPMAHRSGTMMIDLRNEEASALTAQQPIEPSADTQTAASTSAVESEKLLQIITAPEVHYFRTNQLTEKPLVLNDVSSELILVLPELHEKIAVLRLFISDDGGIDKVVVEDSQLPAAAERRIVEAFSKSGFKPGRIGRIAVRSQLRIEVRTTDLSSSPIKLPGGTHAGLRDGK